MAVFMDVLPRLGLTEAESAFDRLKAMAKTTGEEMGLSLGTGATSGLDKLKESAIATERTVSDANAKMASSADLLSAAQEKAAASASAAAKAQALYSDALERQNALGVLTLAQSRELDALQAKATATSIAATTASARATTATTAAAAAQRDHSDATVAAAAASSKFASASDASAASGLGLVKVLNGVGAGAFVATGAAMAVSTDKAADFEQGLIKLQASAGELSSNMKVVADGVKAVSIQTGYSAGELNNAMYTIEKAGYRGADGIKVLTAAAQGASSEQADLGEVVDGLTTSMKDFNVTPEQSTRLMSQMVTAVGESKTSFQDFVGALHSVEPAAAAAHLKLEDVWGTLAQITQSGTSPDQGAQNMNNAINALARPSDIQAKKMAQLGISADEVSQKLGTNGLAGTMQALYSQIADKQDPSTKLVDVGQLTQNAGALSNLHDMLNQTGDGALSDTAKKMAQGYFDGSTNVKDYRKEVMAANDEDKKKLLQFGELTDKVNSFSTRLANGRSTLETANAALADITGTMSAASVAFQTTGDHAGETNAKIAAIKNTFTEADGTVKGFHESQEGLNAQMRDAKQAFNVAAIEMGDVFIPTMKGVAGVLKTTAEFLAEHQDGVHDAVIAVGLLGTTWAAVKIGLAAQGTWNALAGGIDLAVTKMAALRAASTVTATAVEADAAAESVAVAGIGSAALTAVAGVAALGAATYEWLDWGNDKLKDLPRNTENARAFGALGLAERGTRGSGPTEHDWTGITGGSNGPHGGAGDKLRANGASAAAMPDVTPTPGSIAATAPPNFTPGTAGDSGMPEVKKPKGDKIDPIWISAANPEDFKADKDHGITGSSILEGGFDFSPKSIGTFFTALLTDLAMGNPIGKSLAERKLGGSPSNPMYITSVDVDKAQRAYDKAVATHGPDSTEAQTASDKLRATQAAVGTTGGYYDPLTGGLSQNDPSKYRDPVTGRMVRDPDYGGGGKAGDAALLSNVPAGQYVKPGGEFDLGKGLADCSSAVGDLVKIMDGKQTGGPGRLNTGNASTWLPEHGFVPGEGGPGDFRVGYNDHHMQATLPGGTPFNWGSDSAAARGGVGGTGADDPAFTTHYYRPVSPGSGADLTSPANTQMGLTDPNPADLSDINFGGGGGLGLGGMPNSPVFKQSPGFDPNPFAPPGKGGGAPGSIGPFSVPGGVAAAAPGGIGHSSLMPLAAGGGTSGWTPPAPNAAPGSHMPQDGSKPSPGVGNSVTNTPRSWGSGKGAATSLGSTAAGALGGMFPGSQQAGQLADRTIGYVAQLGGIAVEGIMQSLIPTGGGGGIGDPSKSVIGKLAGGVAGAHKSSPNTAGNTAPPGPKPDDSKGQPAGDQTHIAAQNNGTQVMGDMHVHANDAKSFASDQPQNIYPTATR